MCVIRIEDKRIDAWDQAKNVQMNKEWTNGQMGSGQ